MSDDTVIRARHVSKRYLLFAKPRDRLKQMLLWRLGKNYAREFWALRDLSFEIKRGETVGVIGRNGSGKSTLLEIIAGTLAPTEGEVQVNGRVAALLELGSGFNPEYTGRENVFLTGAILGLSRREMAHRFDEIAAFADIGEFMDQPVKHYSSGMLVRLGFAVQVAVSKEVLIVDEALAVGDEAFQRKCIRALEKFQSEGGTVLLVSHDLQTIVRECGRCLLLHQGRLLAAGESKPVVDLYQKLMYSDEARLAMLLAAIRERGWHEALHNSTADLASRQVGAPSSAAFTAETLTEDWLDPNMPEPAETIYGNGRAEITDPGFYNERGQRVNVLVMGQRYRFVYTVRFYVEAHAVHLGMMLKTLGGIDVAGISTRQGQAGIERVPAGERVRASFEISLNVVPGNYFLNASAEARTGAGELSFLQRRVDMCMIRVLPCDERQYHGIAYLEPRFEYQFVDAQGAESKVIAVETRLRVVEGVQR
jgi:homopolymeric O-antigen transport system ATP-binding protein